MSPEALEATSFWWNVAVIALTVASAIAGAFALYYATRLSIVKDADLEKFKAVATSKQTELEREQRKTAEAQRAAAKAQLDLREYVEAVERQGRPRFIDGKKLVEQLRGKPKAKVRLLYVPEFPEAYLLAVQIKRWLGAGERGEGAGWDVSEPTPVPADQTGHDPNAPAAIRYMAYMGLGILTREAHQEGIPDSMLEQPKTPLGALQKAIGEAGISIAIVQFGDRRAAEGELVLVVGPKL